MSALARCLRWSVAAFAFILLASCGGGGGGGGGAPGSGGSLVINPTALNFSAEQNGTNPPPQGVTAAYTEPNVAILVAGFPAGTTPPTWLDLTISGLSSPFTVNVIPNTTVLSPGTYTATVRIATAAADHTLISFRDASVSYTINGFVTASSASLSFDELVGQTTPGAQNLMVSDTGNGSYAWSAGITYQSGTNWLMLNGLSTAGGQTVPAASVSVTVNGK